MILNCHIKMMPIIMRCYPYMGLEQASECVSFLRSWGFDVRRSGLHCSKKSVQRRPVAEDTSPKYQYVNMTPVQNMNIWIWGPRKEKQDQKSRNETFQIGCSRDKHGIIVSTALNLDYFLKFGAKNWLRASDMLERCSTTEQSLPTTHFIWFQNQFWRWVSRPGI